MVDNAKEHGNRTAANAFTLPPTKKKYTCLATSRRPTEEQRTGIHCLCCPAPHWPELEVDIKIWVVNEKN